ncbi:hypothetical protein [Micromonospora yangpuensis]|uniref:Uncharacterized protein n=1 Tax=Micromonospora yangpuensis TaxID=683228 RepID=A0A1C6VFL2_9ACTN|nr:hypothetical protein [Micromonospora yangpuensis]GGM14435.1 hypothetical protein GCM10012279_35680 [Micromonospora yangpuensis]SCL64660.1 hypothetical protein GA0070617_5524 [Micromonospora yangpuensis]
MTSRIYRVHVFDGQYEVLHDRTFTQQLDLEGPGVDGILDRLLQALTRAALAENEPMDVPRLEIREAQSGAKVLDWTGA